jgi:hypothetical protein
MGFFPNLLCVLCKSKKIKDEEIKEIEKKRISILPFAWKYKKNFKKILKKQKNFLKNARLYMILQKHTKN